MLKPQRPILLIVICCIFLTCSKNSEIIPTTENSVGFSGRALDKLAMGVNLTNWFNDYSDKAQFGNRYSNSHFTQIKNAGFTYVRIPVGPSVICDPTNIANIQTANLNYLDQAIKNITAAGLSVTIDIHSSNPSFETKLATDPVSRAAFRQFWKNLAGYFKKYDTSQVFFEIFNEPHIGATQTVAGIDKNWWAPVQGLIIQSIREVTPDHYIIAGAENWNNWYDLSTLKPYSVKNIIYNFHLYEPFAFTHQGATWVGSPYNQLKNLPYPGSPQNVVSLANSASSTDAKYLINWYGSQRYNADSLNYKIRQVYNWGNQNKIPVICNEFGVYRPFAPLDSKNQYAQDMRTLLNKYKMGWSVWDYDDTFGITSYPNNSRSGTPNWDANILSALGLK
jgi:endoglucanase